MALKDEAARPSGSFAGRPTVGIARPVPSSRAGDEDASGHLAALTRALERIEEAVDQETAALRSRARIDLKDFNNRKNHGLLELTRAMRPFEGAAESLSGAVRSRVALLRSKLETNRKVLGMHLEAAREISTILTDAIRDAESDGTYSMSIGLRGQQP